MHRRRKRHRSWAGFEPWGLRARVFGPGEVRLAILSLLSEGPRHGYELMRQLEERTGGAYRASAGSVYPTLQQLEDEELIRSEPDQGKRVYTLTQKGVHYLEAERETIARIWRRSEEWGDWGFSEPAAAEIAGPAMRLARSAFRALTRSHGDPGTLERVREILERARADIDNLVP